MTLEIHPVRSLTSVTE